MNLDRKSQNLLKKNEDIQEEPFAILEDFIEEPESNSITKKIKKELLEKEKENPELQRIKKLAQVSQIGLTDKIQKKIEESLAEEKSKSEEKYIQKTREQLKLMSEEAKTGLTAKIKKILQYQRNRTIYRANQEWEHLKKMAREAQISVTAKIHSTFLEKKEENAEGEESFSCLVFFLGIFFSALFVAFLIEKWLGGN